MVTSFGDCGVHFVSFCRSFKQASGSRFKSLFYVSADGNRIAKMLLACIRCGRKSIGEYCFVYASDSFDLNDYLNLYYNEAFLYGSTGINDGDVIIPEQYLILYGIPESEYESFIGKSLSIELKFPKNYTATPE